MPPKLTAVAPLKLVPVMTTEVPPDAVPDVGLTEVTVGVGALTVKLVAAVTPKVTAVAPEKSLPVIVTTVPPVAGPDVGETDPTAGASGFTTRLAEEPATPVPPLDEDGIPVGIV